MRSAAVGMLAQTACVWEALANKPGNVNRRHDFADVGLVDFLLSAAAIAPVLERARGQALGATILEAIRATRQVTRSNTNLGIVLLLAPLASVPLEEELAAGVGRVLERTTVADSAAVYQAIALASPGGLGQVDEQDVRQAPTMPLRQVMALAAERDLVARQYANGFREVLDEGLAVLATSVGRASLPVPHGRPGKAVPHLDSLSIEQVVIHLHLSFLAAYPDSLIVRKRGLEEAREASRLAREVLDQDYPSPEGEAALERLDAWLRGAGHERNPGTSADLVTACLFAALREGIMNVSARW